MSVLVRGMEMPKEIEPELVIDFAEDLGGKRYARFYHYRYGGLTDWHEIIEIPEPHGDLIDRDELKENGELVNESIGLYSFQGISMESINNARTIIKAEK